MSDFEFSANISENIKEEILNQLKHIEKDNDVKIIFAIESGSRAWGFPSPDSDYDVRFVYAHKLEWYVTISPGRDVIELPIEGDLDINGWDIKKALGLLIKPNPVMLEWLSSPIRYIWNDEICDKLISFSKQTVHGPACLNHYLSLGSQTWRTYIEGKDQVRLKKYFYIVRPAMAIRWMRLHPKISPPMNFQKLLQGSRIDTYLVRELQKLLIAKSQSKELGTASRVPVIDDFIQSEFEWAKSTVKSIKPEKRNLKEEADSLLQQIVMDRI